jgi:hypothetical protein
LILSDSTLITFVRSRFVRIQRGFLSGRWFDQAKHLLHLFSPFTDLHHPIPKDEGAFGLRKFIDRFDHGVVFQSGNKEDAFHAVRIVLLVIHIAAVKHIRRSGFINERFHLCVIRRFSWRENRLFWIYHVRVTKAYTQMELDPGFQFSGRSPICRCSGIIESSNLTAPMRGLVGLPTSLIFATRSTNSFCRISDGTLYFFARVTSN